MTTTELLPLILLGGGAFLLIGAAVHFTGVGSLNNIKSKTVGDGQHGTARWATKQEIQKTYRHIPFRRRGRTPLPAPPPATPPPPWRAMRRRPEFLRVTRLAVCHIDLTGLGIIYDVSTQNSDLCHALFSRFDLRRKFIVMCRGSRSLFFQNRILQQIVL